MAQGACEEPSDSPSLITRDVCLRRVDLWSAVRAIEAVVGQTLTGPDLDFLEKFLQPLDNPDDCKCVKFCSPGCIPVSLMLHGGCLDHYANLDGEPLEWDETLLVSDGDTTISA